MPRLECEGGGGEATGTHRILLLDELETHGHVGFGGCILAGIDSPLLLR